MIETELPPKNNTKDIKLYSQKAISGATFLGGPLAAGYLIGENYKALSKPDAGRKSLIYGILGTVVLFVVLFLMPENIIDKIPSQLIPIAYTALIWGIVSKKQGDVLESHKENNNTFFSGWRAAGVGFVALLILGAVLLAFILIKTNNPAYEIYETQITEFSKNENDALSFYERIEVKSTPTLISELENIVIPKWEENLRIAKALGSIENLPSDLKVHNEILLKYSSLRLEYFKLLKKAISEDTNRYDIQLKALDMKIENELNKLD